jgi:benzoyl-CoA reductase/2-hydroxyglutaryl-CoA dehydratase subunit BcrC/BadD/HgdB
MLRSALGAALLAQHGAGDGSSHFYAGQVIPTTCDWVTRFGDLAALAGVEINSIHRLANPKVKNSHLCLKAWENEIRGLIRFLSQLSGKKISRRELKKSVGRYREAYAAFSDLIDHKRAGRIDQIWFSVVAGSFNFDLVERWSENVHKLNTKLAQKEPATAGGQVFLAGSPIIFPNFKILSLIQEAGLAVVMDDLCSSERILPGPVHLGDDSLEGLTEALSQRYYLGCLCPTFADDDRRINNILSPAHKVMFRGVIFHVLKGCHPFDLESLVLENQIKEAGLKFIRLETDYAKEDTASLLTRLEAYAGTL